MIRCIARFPWAVLIALDALSLLAIAAWFCGYASYAWSWLIIVTIAVMNVVREYAHRREIAATNTWAYETMNAHTIASEAWMARERELNGSIVRLAYQQVDELKAQIGPATEKILFLESRLARFIGPKVRGPNGRFLKSDQARIAQAPASAGLLDLDHEQPISIKSN